MNEDLGLVALDDEYVAAKGLPLAQRYPWDTSKGMYLLQGYHNLHCLVRYIQRLCFVYLTAP